MVKNILRKLTQTLNLLTRLKEILKEDTTNKSVLKRFDEDLRDILTIVQEVCSFSFLKGAPTSDLSSAIHHDICVILQALFRSN